MKGRIIPTFGLEITDGMRAAICETLACRQGNLVDWSAGAIVTEDDHVLVPSADRARHLALLYNREIAWLDALVSGVVGFASLRYLVHARAKAENALRVPHAASESILPEGFEVATPASDSSAEGILHAAAQHLQDRASARDAGGGERSMARIVATFNALTGHALTERDGWAFMVALKLGRAYCSAKGTPDDYQDGAAYFGLMGECAAR